MSSRSSVGTRADPPSVVGDQRVADELDGFDPVVAEDRDRRDAEAQRQPAALPARGARRILAQDLQVARDRGRGQRGLARGIELELGRIDDDVGIGELAELLELGRRERCLCRPAPAEHDDLLDGGAENRRDRGVRRVGRNDLRLGESEHPRHVDGDVAVADHDRPLAVEVEREVLEVGVAVVPGDELGRRPGAGEVFSRDPEPPVGLGPDRVDDRVVQREQVGVLEVTPDLDVAQEPEARLLCDLLVDA